MATFDFDNKRAPGTSRRCFTLPMAACWKCSSQQVAAVLLLGRLTVPNCCLNWWGIRSHQVQRHDSNLCLLLLCPLPSPLFQHWITFSHSLTCQFKTRSIFVGTLFKTFRGEVGEKKATLPFNTISMKCCLGKRLPLQKHRHSLLLYLRVALEIRYN